MTFSVSEAAESWLADAYERILTDNSHLYQIRYYDVFHHGYTRLYKDDRIPTGRTGTSMVKILIEKIQQDAIANQSLFLRMKTTEIMTDDYDDNSIGDYEDDDLEQEELEHDGGFVVVNETKDPFSDGEFEIIETSRENIPEEHKEYTNFVNIQNLPKWELPKNVVEHNMLEKAKIIAWKQIGIPSVVDKPLKLLVRKGIPGTMRRRVWMILTGVR